MSFYDVDELKRVATGRWSDILIAAGMPAQSLDGKNHACPKCGGRDRFAAFPDLAIRGAVHCRHCFTRGSAIPPCDGIATLRWWLGLEFRESLESLAQYLGMQSNSIGTSKATATSNRSGWSRRVASVGRTVASSHVDLSRAVIEQHTKFARDAFRRLDEPRRRRLARHLVVSSSALKSLRVGITSDHRCSTWPMRNAAGDVIGVRLIGLPWSSACSAKWSRRGSQSGIFVGKPDPGKACSLFVTEGASDTAAAISIGLTAIGRASCSSSTHFVDKYLHRFHPASVTVIADHDSPGISGAKRMARDLAQDLPEGLTHINLIVPPGETTDLRQWIIDGANAGDIKSAKPLWEISPARQQQFSFARDHLHREGQADY